MDNHRHVLVRLDSEAAKSWSAAEVVRPWTVAYPPKSATGEEIEVVQAWIDHQRMLRLFRKARLLGSYFTTDRGRLRELARQRGLHHLENVAATTARGSAFESPRSVGSELGW